DAPAHGERGDPPQRAPACALLGGPADQRRLGGALLEVLDDRERFGQEGAVIELEHWELAERIAHQVLGPFLLAGPEIHELLGELGRSAGGAFLRQIQPHAGGIRRDREDVELHYAAPRLWSSTKRRQAPPARSISPSWLPLSTMRPPSTNAMRSAWRTVERRCAITSTARSRLASRSASTRRRSVSGSSAL